MMDPNTITEWTNAFLQQQQTFITGLTLICSVIVASVTALSVFVGFVAQKRYLEIKAEFEKLRSRINSEKQELRDIEQQYSTLEIRVNAMTTDSELVRGRELLDSLIERLNDDSFKDQLSEDTVHEIMSAMSSISITDELEDTKRLINVLSLARKCGLEGLVEQSLSSLKRAAKIK